MGARHGKGKLYHSPNSPIPNYLQYEGDLEHNFFHGMGRLYNIDGSIFIGRFNRGMKWTGDLVTPNNELPTKKYVAGYMFPTTDLITHLNRDIQ